MKDFRAVSIIYRAPSCEAARSPTGQRRLLSQGCCLPLADCTMPAFPDAEHGAARRRAEYPAIVVHPTVGVLLVTAFA